MIDSSKTRSDVLSQPTPVAYRAVVVAQSGCVLNDWRIAADDDQHAASQAMAMVDEHAVELWDGLRFIEHFPPIGESSNRNGGT